MTMWTFVPKPRSAIKTIEWFPSLLKVEGKNWNLKIGDEHPVRREYIELAHPSDEYLAEDKEIHARMEFARYQALGLAYLGRKSEIVMTEAGKSLIREENKSEILLRQLLKWQFPSNIHKDKKYLRMKVFPLEIIIKVIDKYMVLNKFELAFSIFSCFNIDQIEKVFDRIDYFKMLTEDKPALEHKQIYLEYFSKVNLEGATPNTYLDYIDVLYRYLEYTGIFETSGRGYFVKIYVPKRSLDKFSLLVNKYDFIFNENL